MLFWLLALVALAALGGLIGYLLAGINNHDTTAGAVAGTVIGGAIIAVPMTVDAAWRSLSENHPLLAGLLVPVVVLSVLINFFFGDPFGNRRR